MPIFEYKCVDCGTKFEKLIRNSDTNGLACPSCGTKELTQELSTFAAQSGSRSEPMGGGCPAGMCRTPNVCGRN